MTRGRLFHFFLVRLLPVLVLGLLARQALAQADPPGRVARLNHAQGPVVFSPAGDNEWTDAVPNRPLTRGDRVWTDRGSRADMQVGSSAVRMDGRTHLEILALDDQAARLSVTQGTVYVRVRSLPEGENFEIDTPNVAYRAAYPGDYRIDVDSVHGTTRVTIHAGTGAVYGENGQALPLGAGQQITFKGRSLLQLNAQEAPPRDQFDHWAAERNRQEDQAISARFVPREVVGYQQLDAHGKWAHDLTHGMVWFPQDTAADWAPYRHGHWEWISPWGWTWIDDAPWGFAPFHYGRWTQIESRWAWVPGRLGLRPVYAPALVAFVGGGSDGVNWSLPLGGGRPGVAWFPLAPGEAWQPGYRASPVYISNVNRHITVQPNAGYAYQRSAEALTVISAEDFHRGKPVRAGWLRLAANLLTNARIVPPPPMPEYNGVIAQQRAPASRVSPPAAAEIRQVIATATPASAAEPARTRREREAVQREAAQREAQAQAQAQAKAARAQAPQRADADRLRQAAEQQSAQRENAQRAKEAKRDEAASARQQAQRAEAVRAAREQARREQIASRAEQAKRDQIALRAAQTRHEQAAQRAEQARQHQLARRESAKREQLARRAEQTRRQEQARRETQARRQAQARREEQQRREAHAQRVEQARRAADRDAQALRAQREEQARVAAQREAQALREQRAEREAQAMREQRARREEQARRDAEERLQAQREAWQRQQQALAEQWRREHQQWEQQQRDRSRQRPALGGDRRPGAPEVWQRGIPILNPGRTS